MKFVELENVVELVIRPGYKVYFNEALARKLGFPHHAVYTGQTMGVAPETNGAIVRSQYVYCDLLEAVPLGDAKVPLLRMVNMSARRNHANMHQTMKSLVYAGAEEAFRHDRDTDAGSYEQCSAFRRWKFGCCVGV